MKKFIAITCLFYLYGFHSQTTDSIQNKLIEDIIVIGKRSWDSHKESKPLSTLDEYMENSGKIHMIRRGNYAWEPSLNNMTSERISLTIDGMKLFNACTDKMDPITSYVEISNLKSLQVSSGLQSGTHGSNSIGGGINLILNKGIFLKKKWDVSLNTGYESNGDYHSNGVGLSYSSPKFYTLMGAFHRKSNNYKSGSHKEIYFSQFEKFNTYANIGYKISDYQTIEASLIYDDASNVGYPALTMDVKSAKAWISSLSYRKDHLSGVFSSWESKFYFNSITHIMDDTQRPNISIHMDMPGWSKTYGFYSLLKGKANKHEFTANWEGFYNQSKAEMTMYPKDPTQMVMFMYTWPDIHTYNTSLLLEDQYSVNKQSSLLFSVRTGFQNDGIYNDAGLKSIQIFFPETTKYKNRLFLKATAFYQYTKNNLTLYGGGGYGERTPSVSEAYGFYLFNSFDNFDYIGNPTIKKEKSWEGNLTINWKRQSWELESSSSYFYFLDYIIGKPDHYLSPMTIGAQGVKVYTSIDHAFIFNTYIQAKFKFLNFFEWNNRITYNLGKDNQNKSLPFMSPLLYSSSLFITKKKFNAEIQIKGAGKQNDFNPDLGETKTPDYIIYNLSCGYKLPINTYELIIKAGIENIFDKNYSMYSDWNKIPRKGRNFFINLLINL